MTAYPLVLDRLGDDAAAQPPPDAPLPVADPLHRRHPGRVPAAVRVRLRRHARAPASAASPAAATTYLAYVVPGILLITVAGAAQGTAISVAMDMTEGIIARFRTMAIARASVLTGHVIGSVIQTMLALAIVMVVAVLIGFRPTTGPVEWLAAAGLLALAALAVTWLSVALGHGRPRASRPRATCRCSSSSCRS